MPNWCANTIVIRGDESKIKSILEKIGEIPSDQYKLFESLIGIDPDIEKIGWYESNRKRFGTKWDVSPEECNIEFCDDQIKLYPSTAWAPPVPFCGTIANDYGVEVEVTFYEPGGDFAGRVKFDDKGDVIEDLDYTYYEGLFHMDNESFWSEIDEYYFPMDYEKTPEEYVKENFFYLNADERDRVVDAYKLFILDQNEPEDEEV